MLLGSVDRFPLESSVTDVWATFSLIAASQYCMWPLCNSSKATLYFLTFNLERAFHGFFISLSTSWFATYTLVFRDDFERLKKVGKCFKAVLLHDMTISGKDKTSLIFFKFDLFGRAVFKIRQKGKSLVPKLGKMPKISQVGPGSVQPHLTVGSCSRGIAVS